MRDITTLTPASTQLSEISVSPGVHLALVCQGQGLGIPAPTGYLYHPLMGQGLDLIG